MAVSMYSRARFSVASFTGSWWPCARTYRNSRAQGQAACTAGWPRAGRAAQHLTSLSRSFRIRSTTSTSDLSFIQISMFCADDGLSVSKAPPTLAAASPPSPLPQHSPHRLTDGLEVKGLKLLGHLPVPLPVPPVKMGGLEKPPVGAGGRWLWAPVG